MQLQMETKECDCTRMPSQHSHPMMEEAVRRGYLKLVQMLFWSRPDVNEPCTVGDGEGSLLII